MSEIQQGYQNEFMFVLEFNNKQVKELNPILREIIDDLYPNINEDLIIKSWRNKISNQKGDILIKINNHIRSISIKMGSRNSVHVENIESFKMFLQSLGIKDKIIYYYELFHYGVDKWNYKKVLSSSEFCSKNKRMIKKINKAFSTIDVDKIINRFILCGNNSKYQVDGIIYGIPNDFIWINRNDIIETLKESINEESKSVHIGSLFIQPLNRCINGNSKYLWCRDYIQVKWYSLFDDIIKCKNRIIINKKES